MKAAALGLDFGTSNTVITIWDREQRSTLRLPLPPYSLEARQLGGIVPVIPTLINYANNNKIWVGAQVLERGLSDSPSTMRWMKRYVARRSPIQIQAGGRSITPLSAGKDFILSVLHSAVQESDYSITDTGVSVPVEAFEYYDHWLTSLVSQAGLPRIHVIDEPSAAVLGYLGARGEEDNFLLFDCGGGTMHVAVIKLQPAKDGAGVRVLGKSSLDLGGSDIDAWIFEDFLNQAGKKPYDPEVRAASLQLLDASRELKEQLSLVSAAQLVLPPNLHSPNYSLSREQFSSLLASKGFLAAIHRLVRQAFVRASEKGFKEEDISAVLLTGGSSLIPDVKAIFSQLFDPSIVHAERPLDVVSSGAAMFAGGAALVDHIQHEYAIRYLSPDHSAYEYHPLVPAGTEYPTNQPVARLAVKASHADQQYLGLAIFELSKQRINEISAHELVFDSSGAARLIPVSASQAEERQRFWMNEYSPTFLMADPPAQRGEACFEVSFDIDANKRLLITARDLRSGELALYRHAVVTLR